MHSAVSVTYIGTTMQEYCKCYYNLLSNAHLTAKFGTYALKIQLPVSRIWLDTECFSMAGCLSTYGL